MLSCGQLLLAALPVALAIDFDMSCPQSTAFIGSTANITGTIPFPGIKQTNKTLTTDDDEKNQWSITETVFRNSIDFTTTGNSFVNIPFNTSMEKNTTNPHELPYVTCIWTMYFWPDPKGDGATDDDGSCRTIFGSACLDDLQNQYEDLAANYTISEHNSTSPCADFWRITGKKPLPKSCDGPIKNNNQVPSESAGFEPSSTDLLSRNSEALNNKSCPVNLFERHFDGPQADAQMDTAVPTSADNVTTFGRAARLITPYFIIRMANDTLVDKWSDVEIVCAKTTQLNKGSSLPPKDSSGYAIRASMVGVLGLVAVMGWLL